MEANEHIWLSLCFCKDSIVSKIFVDFTLSPVWSRSQFIFFKTDQITKLMKHVFTKQQPSLRLFQLTMSIASSWYSAANPFHVTVLSDLKTTIILSVVVTVLGGIYDGKRNAIKSCDNESHILFVIFFLGIHKGFILIFLKSNVFSVLKQMLREGTWTSQKDPKSLESSLTPSYNSTTSYLNKK